jgi:hypothetical protein
MIIQSKWFCKLLGVRGITLWPFIFINDIHNEVLINHEKIHYIQQSELYVLPFYFLYLKDYLNNRKKFKGDLYNRHYWSYRNIYFEEEAFNNQYNLSYLKTRKSKNYKK